MGGRWTCEDLSVAAQRELTTRRACSIHLPMPLHVTLSFTDALEAPVAGLLIHRCQIRDALFELFDVQLTIASTDLSLDMQTVVGHPITVGFEDEPFLRQMTGIVRMCRQLTSV